MKKQTALIFTIIFFFIKVNAQQKIIPVFISGNDGYKNYRIPAIIQLPDKSLLAFCEGRVNGTADFGNIDIVMKKSSDNGKTWSSLQTIVDEGNLQAGNPAPVVDVTDKAYSNGRIFLFYNTGNNSEAEIRNGNGLRQVWYKTSVDNGATWSAPVNITLQVHRPKQPQINSAYNFKEDWRSFANTPGHAMQFQKGKYKGRIFIGANHSAGIPQEQFMDYKAFGFYTADHGKTFHISEEISLPGSNESTAAELSNNKLIMNSRNQKGNIKTRIVSISSNGGASWDTTYFDRTLVDPINEGSLLTICYKRKENMLAFCNAADTVNRNNLTLRMSYNDGKTWNKNFVIDRDDNKKDYTAYSDLTKISKNRIGVLYERNNYTEIVFTTLKWK